MEYTSKRRYLRHSVQPRLWSALIYMPNNFLIQYKVTTPLLKL